MKWVISRQLPDSPLPQQGASDPICGLTGLCVYLLYPCYVCLLLFLPLLCWLRLQHFLKFYCYACYIQQVVSIDNPIRNFLHCLMRNPIYFFILSKLTIQLNFPFCVKSIKTPLHWGTTFESQCLITLRKKGNVPCHRYNYVPHCIALTLTLIIDCSLDTQNDNFIWRS